MVNSIESKFMQSNNITQDDTAICCEIYAAQWLTPAGCIHFDMNMNYQQLCMYAIAHRNFVLAEYLIVKHHLYSIDLNHIYGARGNTLFLAACMQPNFKLMKLMHDNGADIFQITNSKNIIMYICSNMNYSLMTEADQEEQCKIIKYLLSHGLSINLIEQRMSALDYACTTCNLDFVKILLENGAQCSKHTKSYIRPRTSEITDSIDNYHAIHSLLS